MENYENREGYYLYSRDSYWLRLAKKELPRVGKLYRVTSRGFYFMNKKKESVALKWGTIVMLVSVEDEHKVARRLASQFTKMKTVEEVLKEGIYFDFKFLWEEKLSPRLFCLNTKWSRHFELVETSL